MAEFKFSERLSNLIDQIFSYKVKGPLVSHSYSVQVWIYFII
jgi:hypothetical protein